MILRESGLALIIGVPTIDDVEAAEECLTESVDLGSPDSPLQLRRVADLASVEITKAIVVNDRVSLLKALSHGDDSKQSSVLLAQTGLALSLVPAIAPDLMATSLGTPGEFTTAIPGWAQRVVAYGAGRLDRFLLPLAEARLQLLRALNSPEAATPSPFERAAAALLLVERFAPRNGGDGSRWAKSGPLALLAIGTICSAAAVSVGLLGQSSPDHLSWANRTLQYLDSQGLSSPTELLGTASWIGLRLGDLSPIGTQIRAPRYDIGPFESLLRSTDGNDSTAGASRLIGRDLHLIVNAVRARIN